MKSHSLADDEIMDLLSATLHGPLPTATMHRVFFAAEEKPGESKFLGVAIIEADDFLIAVIETKRLGFNPGGQVAGFEIPPDKLGEFAGPACRNHLMQLPELKERFGAMVNMDGEAR